MPLFTLQKKRFSRFFYAFLSGVGERIFSLVNFDMPVETLDQELYNGTLHCLFVVDFCYCFGRFSNPQHRHNELQLHNTSFTTVVTDRKISTQKEIKCNPHFPFCSISLLKKIYKASKSNIMLYSIYSFKLWFSLELQTIYGFHITYGTTGICAKFQSPIFFWIGCHLSVL